MSPIERLQCVLQGRRPDRPPFGFWHHFPPDQVSGPAAVAAHLEHLQRYELDFLKVMNDNGYPHHTPIQNAGDLASIGELRGDEEEFSRQLDLLSRLRAELRGVWMITTLFNAFSVLRHLVQPPKEHNPPQMDASVDQPSRRIKAFLAEDPQAVNRALATIGENLSRFVQRCLEAGADGVFLSVRDDWVESSPQEAGLYARLVRPSDLEILKGASGGRFNMLHACGKAVHLRELAEYPVHAINWADREAGPSIAEVKQWAKPALCAGIDNLRTLPTGTPKDIANEVADAIRQAGDRPIIIAPGCTYDPRRVPRENLEALSNAVRQARC